MRYLYTGPKICHEQVNIFLRPRTVWRSSSLALSSRATRHDHTRACHSSHAAAPEHLGDMRRSPGGEEIDEHEAGRILWQQTRHTSQAHGLRHGRWGPRRMGCSAAHLARQAASKDVPARPQAGSCGSKLPHWNGSHSVSTRGLQGGAKGQGSRMSAQPQGTVPGRAPSTTMSRNHAPLASS